MHKNSVVTGFCFVEVKCTYHAYVCVAAVDKLKSTICFFVSLMASLWFQFG